MPDHDWICGNCKENNPPYTEVCRECGKPPVEPPIESVGAFSTSPPPDILRNIEPPLDRGSLQRPTVASDKTDEPTGPRVKSLIAAVLIAPLVGVFAADCSMPFFIRKWELGWFTLFGSVVAYTMEFFIGIPLLMYMMHREYLTRRAFIAVGLTLSAFGGIVATALGPFPFSKFHELIPFILVSGIVGGATFRGLAIEEDA